MDPSLLNEMNSPSDVEGLIEQKYVMDGKSDPFLQNPMQGSGAVGTGGGAMMAGVSSGNFNILQDLNPLEGGLSNFSSGISVEEVNDPVPVKKKSLIQLPEEKPERVCVRCGKLKKKILWCSRCQKVFYCSATCQKKHWNKHKKVCIPAPKKKGAKKKGKK